MFDGSIIKKLRNDKKINQAELAEIVGCTQANISSYETNRTRPDYDILINLADYFNVSIDYLFNRSSINLDTLSENENYIIETFRNLRPETKIEFLSMVNMVKVLRDAQKRVEGE